MKQIDTEIFSLFQKLFSINMLFRKYAVLPEEVKILDSEMEYLKNQESNEILMYNLGYLRGGMDFYNDYIENHFEEAYKNIEEFSEFCGLVSQLNTCTTTCIAALQQKLFEIHSFGKSFNFAKLDKEGGERMMRHNKNVQQETEKEEGKQDGC